MSFNLVRMMYRIPESFLSAMSSICCAQVALLEGIEMFNITSEFGLTINNVGKGPSREMKKRKRNQFTVEVILGALSGVRRRQDLSASSTL
jgi:hypothetical protein